MIKTEKELMNELKEHNIDTERFESNKDYIDKGFLGSTSRKSFIKEVERLYNKVDSLRKKKGEEKQYEVSEPKLEMTAKVDKRIDNGGDNSAAVHEMEKHIYYRLVKSHIKNELPTEPVTIRSWSWRLKLPMKLSNSASKAIEDMIQHQFGELTKINGHEGTINLIDTLNAKLNVRSYQTVKTAFNSLAKKGLITFTASKRAYNENKEAQYFSVEDYENHMKPDKESILKRFNMTDKQYNNPWGKRIESLKLDVQSALLDELGVYDIFTVFDVKINKDLIEENLENNQTVGQLYEHYFTRMHELAERDEKKKAEKFENLSLSENLEYVQDITKACNKQFTEIMANMFNVDLDLVDVDKELDDYKSFLLAIKNKKGFGNLTDTVKKNLDAQGVYYYRFNKKDTHVEEFEGYTPVKKFGEYENYEIEQALPF